MQLIDALVKPNKTDIAASDKTGAPTKVNPLLPAAVTDVSYAIDGCTLIDAVSCRLDGPGRTVVLGPNGAGKSVLLRLCHGLLSPSAGSIRWGSASPAETMQRRGMVFQRPVLLRRSVAANVAHVLKIKGLPRARCPALVKAALAQSGLTALAHRQARTLSGGEQQRLAIARAWLLEPHVVLLDEPTANLDPGATRAVEDLIVNLGAAGTKIIMTTHDIAQARRLADEVMFLHHGRLLEHRPAVEFFAGPDDANAAGFIAGQLIT